MNNSQTDVASFGPFQLFSAARAIEKEGVPLALGNRALDILIALVERAGEVVSHRELISRAWGGLVVEPGNLRVHIAGLRKALGDSERKARYIANVPGRGYCFIHPITRRKSEGSPAQSPEYPCGASRQRLVLPPMLARMVGREEKVRSIVADLIAERFVTIIGPGGLGKTTAAVAVAHAMLEEFADAVCFVDVGAVTDSKLVAATVASTLGLTIQTSDVMPTLLECLRTLRVLLVLDNCEHVIDSAAKLAELIFKEAPGVHILATSREALRVEGERAYWLPPLASPPPDSSMKAADVARFPAVQLFMDRAAASGGRFELTEQNAPVVAGICGRLDGIALAIELAAGRVGSHGIAGTAELLNSGLGLDWHGRRTALPRHQTLRALLDWSYGFLDQAEQLVLQRLSIFVGTFTIESAQTIAGKGAPDKARVVKMVDSLVSKSLVSATTLDGNATRYRLVETTRVYASEKLQESGEASAVAERHARYFTRLLDSMCDRNMESLHDSVARALSEDLGNIRAALAWCFAEAQERHVLGSLAHAASPATLDAGRIAAKIELGVELAAASAPVFLGLSLLNECHKWSKVALTLIDEALLGSRRELVLQEAQAISSAWTRGDGDEVRAALTRGLEIAQQLRETSCRLRLLVGMHVFLVGLAEFRGSLALVDELDVSARGHTDVSYAILSDWMRGSSEHFIGNQAAARHHFQSGFARVGPRNMQLFGLDYRVRALVTFARVLWLSGSPDRAIEIAKEAIHEASQASKPLNVCFSLLYTAPVFLWCGDLETARSLLEKLMGHPNWHALPSLHVTGLALKGELLIHLGEAELGTTLSSQALSSMRADRRNTLIARAACGLAEGLTAVGRFEEAHSVITNAITDVTNDGEMVELPELLRVKAMILLSMPASRASEAEDCLMRSLEYARNQSARSWELRTALTLARLRASQGNQEGARQFLAPLYDQFTEGFQTRDLEAARQFLADLA